MALEQLVRQLVQKAVDEKDESSLNSAHDIIETHVFGAPGPNAAVRSVLSKDVVVVLAEAATRLGKMKMANDLLERFLRSNPTKDQFLCRALLCGGVVMASFHTGKKGDELISGILESLQRIYDGIQLAIEEKDRYSFLVYNGSVDFWNVARELLRDGTRAKLIPLITNVWNALESMNDPHYEWRIKFSVQVALCSSEAGKADDAAKALATASDLASKHCQDMRIYVLKNQIYANRNNSGNLSKAKGECNTPELKAQYSTQVLKCGIVTDQKQVENEIIECEKNLFDGNGEVPKSAGQTEWTLVGELARVCLRLGIHDKAERYGNMSKNAKSLIGRVSSDLVACQLAVIRLGDEAGKYTPKMIAVHVDALKKLDKSLISASRSDDTEFVEEICTIIWNLGRPLLQPNLRFKLYQSFTRAANELANIKSPLHELRVKFHFELAKCEVAQDLLMKAAVQAEKAFLLDYVADPKDVERYGMERPLDRYIVPLRNKLELRTNIYKMTECPEEEAELLIQQATDAVSAGPRRSLLKRALEILSLAQENDGNTNEVNEEKSLKRALLYADVVKAAWKDGAALYDVVEIAAPPLLAKEWDVVKQKDLVLDQCQASYIMAEAYIAKIREEEELEIVDLLEEFDFDNDEIHQIILDTEKGFCEGIVNGIDGGIRVKQDWVVLNGALMFWNHHVLLFKNHASEHLLDTLRHIFKAITSISTRDSPTVLRIALSLGDALVRKHAKDCGLSLEECEAKPGNASDVLKEAEEVLATAKSYIVLPVHGRQIISLEQKVLHLMGRGDAPKGGAGGGKKDEGSGSVAQENIISSIERVHNTTKEEDKIRIVNEAAATARSEPHVEMCARLSVESLRLKQGALSIELASLSAKAASLPDEIYADLSVSLKSESVLLPTKRWRWVSVAESVQGQAVVLLVDPTKQERNTQNTLRRKALTHFCAAAKFAVYAQRNELVMDNASYFWKCALPLAQSAVAKELLVKPLEDIVSQCENIQIGRQDSAVVSSLYAVLAECLGETGSPSEAVEWCSRGIQAVHRSQHKILWQTTVKYSTRLGEDQTRVMGILKGYDAVTQAKAWLTVARSAPSEDRQERAFRSALSVLKDPRSKAEVALEFGLWLFLSNRSPMQSKNKLNEAEMLLVDLDVDPDAEVADDRSMGSSIGSRSGKSSILSNRLKSRQSSRTLRSRKSRARKSRAKSQASIRSGLVGIYESELGLSCRHLDMLARICLGLSLVSPGTEKLTHLLRAHDYYMRLWKTSTSAVKLSKEYEEREMEGVNEEKNGDGKSADNVEPSFPEELIRWTNFSVSDDIAVQFMKNVTDHSLNAQSIEHPELTLAYLDLFIELLVRENCFVHVLPHLELCYYISKHILRLPRLSTVYRFRQAHILGELGMHELSLEKFQEGMKNVQLFGDERRVFMQDVQERLLAKSAASSPQQEVKTHARDIWRAYGRRTVDSFSPRLILLLQSRELMRFGEFALAKSLLKEVIVHARAFDDNHTLADALLLTSELLALEGKVDEALKSIQEAQQFPNTMEFWINSLSTFSNVLLAKGDPLTAVCLLRAACETLNRLGAQGVNGGTDAMHASALLQVNLSEILSRWREPDAEAEFAKYEEAVNIAQRACTLVDHPSFSPVLVDVAHRAAKLSVLSKPVDILRAHEHMRRSIELYSSALRVANEENSRLQSILNSDGFSLPINRKLAEILAELSELEIDMAWMEYEYDNEIFRVDTPPFPVLSTKDSDTVRDFLKQCVRDNEDTEKSARRIRLVDDSTAHATRALDLTTEKVVLGVANCALGKVYRFQSEVDGTSGICWKKKESEEEVETKEGEEKPVEEDADKVETDEVADDSLSKSARYFRTAYDMSREDDWDAASRACLWGSESLGHRNSEECALMCVMGRAFKEHSNMLQLEVDAGGHHHRLKLLLNQQKYLRKSTALWNKVPQFERVKKGIDDTSVAYGMLRIHEDMKESISTHIPEDMCVLSFTESIRRDTILTCCITKNSISVSNVLVNMAQLLYTVEKLGSFFNIRQATLWNLEDVEIEGDLENSQADWDSACAFTSTLVGDLLSDINELKDFNGWIVLIPSDSLAVLPLECASVFRGMRGVSRDFSVPFLMHRLERIPNSNVIVPSKFRYLVDPDCEDKREGKNLTSFFHESILDVHSTLSKDWQGASGSESVVGPSLWQSLLLDASAALSLGYGNVLSYIGPSNIADLDLTKLSLYINMDYVHNDVSWRHKTVKDTKKSVREVELESVDSATMLLSLAGCGCIVCTANAATPTSNMECMDDLVAGIVKGQSPAEILMEKYKQLDVVDGESEKNADADENVEKTEPKFVCPSPDLSSYVVWGIPSVCLAGGK